jgi:hypothetical protein
MPSAQDILDAINAADGKLDNVNGKLDTANTSLNDIKGKLDAVKASVDAVDADVQKVEALLLWGFSQLITLGEYTNLALFQNDQQNDTMICILEHISKNTCSILNESHKQTELQESMRHSTKKIADLVAASHPEAEFAREREEALRREIEECCPPKRPEPVCHYVPCKAPDPLQQQPPQTQPPPGPKPIP